MKRFFQLAAAAGRADDGKSVVRRRPAASRLQGAGLCRAALHDRFLIGINGGCAGLTRSALVRTKPKGGLLGGTIGFGNYQTGAWLALATSTPPGRTPPSAPASAPPHRLRNQERLVWYRPRPHRLRPGSVSRSSARRSPMRVDHRGERDTPTVRLDCWSGRRISWATGRPSSNISMPISARRLAARAPARPTPMSTSRRTSFASA